MSPRTTMNLIISLIGFALIIAAAALWWHVFLGRANPPLSQKQLTIATSTPTTPVSHSTSTTTPIVAGENGPLPTEKLGVDKVTFTIEIASTMMQEANGLSFRPSLAPNGGMLFTFKSPAIQSFWMKDMKFPLDMIWIGGNTVVGFAQNVPAPAPGTALWSLSTYTSPDGTDKVLEVNSGTVAKYNIKVGDMIRLGQ